MEYKETQNSILFKNEYEEEFLKLTKEFGVDAVSKAYSNDEFSIYFFSCIEDQDKINSLMNSLKKKTKCDIIENFDLDTDNISNVFDIDQEEIDMILSDKESFFSDEKHRVFFTRLELLSNDYFFSDSKERVRILIETALIGRCNLSKKTLAKFANVPLDIFDEFLANKEIEDKYLVDIYLNLYTLFIVLYTKNEQYRAV